MVQEATQGQVQGFQPGGALEPGLFLAREHEEVQVLFGNERDACMASPWAWRPPAGHPASVGGMGPSSALYPHVVLTWRGEASLGAVTQCKCRSPVPWGQHPRGHSDPPGPPPPSLLPSWGRDPTSPLLRKATVPTPLNFSKQGFYLEGFRGGSQDEGTVKGPGKGRCHDTCGDSSRDSFSSHISQPELRLVSSCG